MVTAAFPAYVIWRCQIGFPNGTHAGGAGDDVQEGKPVQLGEGWLLPNSSTRLLPSPSQPAAGGRLVPGASYSLLIVWYSLLSVAAGLGTCSRRRFRTRSILNGWEWVWRGDLFDPLVQSVLVPSRLPMAPAGPALPSGVGFLVKLPFSIFSEGSSGLAGSKAPWELPP